MAALHLIGIDLKARHRVRLALVTHQEVAAGLVGIGVMRPLLNHDQSGKDSPRLIIKGILVEQVTRGVLLLMQLLMILLLYQNYCTASGVDFSEKQKNHPAECNLLIIHARHFDSINMYIVVRTRIAEHSSNAVSNGIA